ncbi:MAG: glycosyltransferase, partial [Candidatus Sericytochromatia bacterium]
KPMNRWINRALALTSVGTAAFLVGSGLRMMRHVKKELARTRNQPSPEEGKWPRVALMVPCKDVDPDLEQNLRMLLQQDYPNYEIVFMTLDQHDLSYPILQRMVAESKVPARIVFGGFSKQRCQKLDNILAGIDSLDPDIEIFAWADSDVRAPREWLRQLVAPLSRDTVGTTTSFRWYRPEPGRLDTYMLSLWTGIQFCHFHINPLVAVWGGSMSVTRRVFDEMDMRTVWEYALADDCVLNHSTRKSGRRVEFVVPSMTSISSDHSLKDNLIFAVRQAVIAKHTLKEIWYPSVLGLTLLHLALFRGAQLTYLALRAGQPVPLVALAMFSFIPGGMLQSLGFIQAIRQIAASREEDDPLDAKPIWALLSPLAYTFLWGSLLASACTDRFVWRGIYYKMLNSHETEVYAYPDQLGSADFKEETPSGRV